MKPAPFKYYAPGTLAEAAQILADVAPHDGRILAGGQTLVPTMAFRVARPFHLVDINGIEELRRLEVIDGQLRIGACVRHAAFHRPAVAGPLGALLSDVVKHIAHYPIRTRGTFCGSIANADPASEWCTVSVCLDAEMVATSVRGNRVIPAREFFQGIMTTALAEEELLSEVRIPLLPEGTRFGFEEFSRRAGDFAVAMAIAIYDVRSGTIAEPKLTVGGAEPYPRRMVETENFIDGKSATAELFEAAATLAASVLNPMEDAANSADFRRDVAETVLARALGRTIGKPRLDA